MIRRRHWIAGTGAAVLAFAGLPARAQEFPKAPVKLIVPFPPGGPTDTVARLIAQQLQELWGQSVIVDYKAGAGTVIGVDYVAKSAPDGLTIGMVNSSLAVNPSLRKNMPYQGRRTSRITQIANLQLALVARPDAPFNSLAELIAYAKKNPGKLTYGTPGAGSTTHLGTELLKRETGIDMLHSPFKGSAPAHTELMGGRIDLVADPFLSVIPYVKAGRMKMIATMGDRRVPGYDYPTVAETAARLQRQRPARLRRAGRRRRSRSCEDPGRHRARAEHARDEEADRGLRHGGRRPRGPTSSTRSSPPRCGAGRASIKEAKIEAGMIPRRATS